VLDLNETQTAMLSLVFRFCDDRDLPLLDLADLRTTLRFLTLEEGKPVLEDGGISKSSVGVVLRSILTLEEALVTIGGTIVYRVCEYNATVCSNMASVTF
jgi:hypothetical protein